MKTVRFDDFTDAVLNVAAARQMPSRGSAAANHSGNFSNGGLLPKSATADTPPVLYNRENHAKLVYMIEAKFSPADAADLRPGQPVDVKLK